MLETYLLLLDNKDDDSRFIELYNENYVLLGNYAFFLLKDKHLAEDAVSDAFLKLARVFSRIKDKTNKQVRSYLLVITRNAALKIYNKRHKETPVDKISIYDTSVYYIEDTIDEQLIREKALRIIKKMDPKYGDVLILKFQCGLQNKEIAESLGITLSNAKTRLLRGKQILQDMMKEGNYDRQSV